MKWWVFNEEQLGHAIAAYRARTNEGIKCEIGTTSTLTARAGFDEICDFLNSPEARAHNLRGDK